MPHYHWHIEIIPKLTHVAGFEWGTGFYINPTPPEEAAKFLREAHRLRLRCSILFLAAVELSGSVPAYVVKDRFVR